MANMGGYGMMLDIGFLADNLRWAGGMRYYLASAIKIMALAQRKVHLIADGKPVRFKSIETEEETKEPIVVGVSIYFFSQRVS